MIDYYLIDSGNNMSTNIITLISALLGAGIGGLTTYIATIQAHKNNIELEKLKEKETEKAVVLSIIEELKVLKETYQEDMDELYDNLPPNKYIETYYTITQDFMTVYSNNASKLGIIKHEKLRNSIIKTYTYLKKYIEYLLNYGTSIVYFEKCRSEFIARVYPNLINSACSKANNELEVSKIKDDVRHNNWGWFTAQYLTQAQVINFIKSDDEQIADLIYLSQDLKQKYYELKNLIDKTTDLALCLYKE